MDNFTSYLAVVCFCAFYYVFHIIPSLASHKARVYKALENKPGICLYFPHMDTMPIKKACGGSDYV